MFVAAVGTSNCTYAEAAWTQAWLINAICLSAKGRPSRTSSRRAQRLKVGNACPPISTFSRAIPSNGPTAVFAATYVLPCTRGSYTPANCSKRRRPASQCVGSCSCPHTAKRSRATVQSDEMPEPYKRTSSCATCTRKNDTHSPNCCATCTRQNDAANYLRGHENTYAASYFEGSSLMVFGRTMMSASDTRPRLNDFAA